MLPVGQADSQDEDSLEDIRLPWVDDPNPSKFSNHRSLVRYSHELKTITDVMREYSRSDDKVDADLLNATLKYGLKAHDIYKQALSQWLSDNPTANSHPIVQKLCMEYKGKTDFIRYYSRAMADPETRSEATACTTASNELNAGTSVAHCSLGSSESASVIQGQQRKIEHLRKQSQWKDLIVEEKVLESNLLALRLKKKDLELSNLQQFVDDLESVTDAAELNEVYYTRRPSPTPGLQSGDSATAPSITGVPPSSVPFLSQTMTLLKSIDRKSARQVVPRTP